MSISEIPISRYNPGYTMDYDKMALIPIPNYFSDLLAKQSELSKKGESQLAQQEIEELSDKCDMNQMSSQEYKDFINYLADKGVIDRPEQLDFDPGERIAIKPGGTCWLEEVGSSNSRSDGIAHYLNPGIPKLYEKLLSQLAVSETLRKTGVFNLSCSYT